MTESWQRSAEWNGSSLYGGQDWGQIGRNLSGSLEIDSRGVNTFSNLPSRLQRHNLVTTGLIMTSLLFTLMLGAITSPSSELVGSWSESVADSRGYTLRGRLVLVDKVGHNGHRESVLFVELQDTCQFIGNGIQVFCDMGKSDFRPEYPGGLNCDLVDKNSLLLKPVSFAFGGAVPRSEWVKLPVDASIRVRATPFGLRRDNAKVICPHLGAMWVIENSDKGEYMLKGTFVVQPRVEKSIDESLHAWTGKLVLPPLKLVPTAK